MEMVVYCLFGIAAYARANAIIYALDETNYGKITDRLLCSVAILTGYVGFLCLTIPFILHKKQLTWKL